MIYKIIAKTVANRLQEVLDDCIDAAQNAFVPRRLITDNVLLTYEVLHSFKNKKSRRKGFVALKLDMSKAYDRVEWPFIKGLSALMRLSSQERKICGAKIGDGQQVSIWEDSWVPGIKADKLQNSNPNSGLRKALDLGIQLGLSEVEVKDSNKVAHAIATEGLKKGDSTYLLSRVPPGAEVVAVAVANEERRWTKHLREMRGLFIEEEIRGFLKKANVWIFQEGKWIFRE
ncbi:hypothetical protein PVK06_042461 [Gossypium arboreum]|uniref:Reverse transcriptase n=1 Tax=Gossypium arboreum TaxID=29729 RepID=A0ABR0MMM8_GOSAR|nr:hypothetical protein PVK06_042461 [Gossypium arboreum]